MLIFPIQMTNLGNITANLSELGENEQQWAKLRRNPVINSIINHFVWYWPTYRCFGGNQQFSNILCVCKCFDFDLVQYFIVC